MKTKYFLKASIILFLISLSFSCGKGGGDLIDALIPDLSANWKNTSTIQQMMISFFFILPNSDVASSAFDGNETVTHSNNTADHIPFLR